MAARKRFQEDDDSVSGGGLGPESAGQSGDNQGLSDVPDADSESVDELIEEGQAFEAEVISGVEDAPNADEGEVRTREVPEDDVPRSISIAIRRVKRSAGGRAEKLSPGGTRGKVAPAIVSRTIPPRWA